MGIYTTHVTRSVCITMVRAAKERGWRIAAGGPDAANYAAEYLERGVDVVVRGEGEGAMAELVRCDWASADVGKVKGLAYRDPTGNVVFTPPRNRLEIDSIPWPDRAGVDIDMYQRSWRRRHNHSSLNLITTRGCGYACKWCSHAVFGNSRRQRDAADCAAETEFIHHRYGPDRLWYADDVFTYDAAWLRRYAGELQKRDVHIPFETISRADRLQDPETVRTIARMGCFRIWIGAESGSDRVLRAMNRGVTAEEILRAVRLCRDAGIETGIFIMWGYPGETLEDIEATAEFVLKARPDVFFTTVVHPIKNTPLWHDLDGRLIPPDNWETASDKDIAVLDMLPEEYYRTAGRWLKHRAAEEKRRTDGQDPSGDAQLEIRRLRTAMLSFLNKGTGQ